MAEDTLTTQFDPAALAKRLEEAQRAKRLAEHSRPWQPSMTPATSLGYACERRSVYQRTQPDKAAPIGEELASIFEEGNLHQKDVRAELLELGYEVVEAEVNFKDQRLEISGTIDGKLDVKDPSHPRGRRRVPVEIKSTSGSPPADEAAWRNSETPLLRRYFAQLQTYLFLTNEPWGLGIFKNKITGLWSVVAVSLDYEYAEGILQRAERIRDAVERWEDDTCDTRDVHLPLRLADRSECSGCPFRETVCFPADAAVDPLLLAEDVDLLAQLIEREACDSSATRFDKLDKAVKERFKLTAGERFVVGGTYMIEKRKHGKGIRIDIGRLGERT